MEAGLTDVEFRWREKYDWFKFHSLIDKEMNNYYLRNMNENGFLYHDDIYWSEVTINCFCEK